MCCNDPRHDGYQEKLKFHYNIKVRLGLHYNIIQNQNASVVILSSSGGLGTLCEIIVLKLLSALA